MRQTKKLIISIIALIILIAGFSVNAVYITNNRDTKEAPTPMTFSQIILSSDYTTMYDSSKLKISYKKKTDVFVVTNKETLYSFKTGIDQLTEKYTYRALDSYNNLSDEEKENTTVPNLSTMSDTFINRANSVLAVTYYDDNLTTQNLESADSDVIKTYKVETSDSNIFNINYQFSEVDLSIDVIFTFSDTGIKVDIPDTGITGEANNNINNIAVFPFLGAAGGANYKYLPEEEDYDYDTIEKVSDITGYSVIPDGSGALVRFVENSQEFKRIELPVYGLDPSLNFMAEETASKYNLDKRASMPMFGMVHGSNQNAFLAYATSGDSYMTIVSEPYGLNNVYYNYTYARFNYNSKYFQVYNESGEGTTVLRDSRYHYDISMTYTFIDNDKANYIGIADTYKDYISSSLEKRDASEDIPLRLDFLMSDATSSFIGYNDTIVTTSSDVRNILNDVKSLGITNINSGLLGYQSGGSTLQSISGLDFNNSIGSKSSYKSLISDFNIEGIDISFINDNLMINSTKTSLTGKATRHVGGTYNELIDPTLGNKDILVYNYLRSNKVYSYTTSQVSSIIKSVNPESTTIKGTSNKLISDNALERETAKEDYESTYKNVSNKLDINAVSPNSYLWPYITRFLNAPAYNSQYLFETDSVPLISYILRDYIEVYADYSNFSFYDTASQLRMIDYNMYPSFILTEESSHLLINSNSNEYFSTEYSLYKDRINEIYTNVNSILSSISSETWESRTVLAPGVILNTYSNNKSVIINYTDEPYNYLGTVIDRLTSKVV